MVKYIVTILISTAILFGGAIYEQTYVKNSFIDLHDDMKILYEKLDAETATVTDVYAVQNKWIDKKMKLHAFISHNDIKEFDMWIAETIAYTKQKNYREAIAKIEVAIELTEQIPKGYLIKFENIF